MAITHSFVSAVPDDGDPNLVGPNEWNAEHVVEDLDAATLDGAVKTDFATASHTHEGITGPQGPQGDPGVPGPPGADGTPRYTWIKYADTPTTGMSDTAGDKPYIGIAYNKTTAIESNNYADYEWSLIQGPKGDTGVQGPPGADGTPRYTWIKYADTPTTGMSDTAGSKPYIGIAYNKTTATESSNYGDYEWSLIQGPQGNTGVQGPQGPNGESLYTWIKYADSPTTGMSDDPTNKSYIGLAYNKSSQTESTNYEDYMWALIKGAQGIQGPAGPSGQSLYTWVKYADDTSGTNMADTPDGKSCIGLAYNKTSSTESSNPADYSWALIHV